MILVLLGTFTAEFKRPLTEIEELCKNGTITEEVIVQSGHTSFNSTYFTVKPFIQHAELMEYYKKANIVITQAGTGSLTEAIKLKKKIIAIARLSKYGEHIDDHQNEILDKFTLLNFILPWRETGDLKVIVGKINDFIPDEFISNKPTIANYLANYIDHL